jgi:hypothetical protein
MTVQYYFPIEAVIENNEMLDSINATMQRFGFGERISITADIAGTIVALTGATELPAAGLILIQQTLQKNLDAINTTNIKLVVREGRKL